MTVCASRATGRAVEVEGGGDDRVEDEERREQDNWSATDPLDPRDWITVQAEITKKEDFAPRMGSMVRRALFQVAPKASWTDKLRRAAAALKSFSITVAANGSITAGVDIEPLEGTADSGNLSDDLTDLLVALGEAAQEGETGIAFLVDEVQFLRTAEFEALIAGLHRTVQRQLPITLIGAGLPQLPRLAGEQKPRSPNPPPTKTSPTTATRST